MDEPFSWVGVAGTWEGAVAFEVLGENVRILAHGTEVDCAATFGKEEETIEALEQHGRRLVDRAENAGAGISMCVFESSYITYA